MKLDKVKMYGRYLSEFLLPDQIQILEKEVIKLFKEPLNLSSVVNQCCGEWDSEGNCNCSKDKALDLSSVSQQRELLIAELNKTDLEYIQQQGCTDILAEDLLKAINNTPCCKELKSSGDFRDDDNRESQSEYFGKG